jgi:DNA replication protein DnaC
MDRTLAELAKLTPDEIKSWLAKYTPTPKPDHGQAEPQVFSDCSSCRGCGYLRLDVPVGHADFGKLVECPCGLLATQRLARAWATSGIPKRLTDATFDTFPVSPENADVVAVIRGPWLQDGQSWLLLYGLSSRGKSGLAVSAQRFFHAQGRTTLFLDAPSLFDRIRQTWDDTLGFKEHELHQVLREVDVLVIDDLGKEQPTAWVQTRLYVLLNDRYNAEKLTIITTNLEESELLNRLGPAIYSRIEDACGASGEYVLPLRGPDLRAGRRPA